MIIYASVTKFQKLSVGTMVPNVNQLIVKYVLLFVVAYTVELV